MHEAYETQEIQRFDPSVEQGLTDEQVKSRIEQNLINFNSDVPTKSIKQIIRDNTLTLFNLINLCLGIAVFCVGSYKNLLFLGVMFCNIAIGIFQEVRAKRTIDRLSIISSVKAHAIRNGEVLEIGVNDIVLDDVLELSNGNQIPSDCVLLSGSCDVNESLLTGESDSIHKNVGDMLYSGSYIVSGKCRARVEHIAGDNFASSISAEAKYVKKVNSEIMFTLRKIIKLCSFIIVPVGLLLFWNQYEIAHNITASVVSTVAQITSMIPEGLVLLTSTVLAVSVIRLSKHKVLVQELFCIETLARVDVLCLDKTGTITEGCMELVDIVPYGDSRNEDIENALCGIVASLDDNNATFNAIKEKFGSGSDMTADNIVPFSSEKKWSGVHFEQGGTYVIGAAEFILDKVPEELLHLLEKYSKEHRALIIAHSPNDFNDRDLPDDIEVCGVLLLVDKIRVEAPQTLKYFEEQGVNIKVISGDNVLTVSDVARRAGVKDYDKYVDATTLITDIDIKRAAEEYTVFGRVTPVQKKKLVCALKESGHTVAMTGDGVNDVLALKEADCSVAMASGSDAARNVSQLVLLNSNFSSMPKVVAEGRRTINNIERSASLFLVKSIYMTVLAILFIFVNLQAPFIPIQLTLVNAFTIGIPSFILALEPNNDRIKGSFFRNVLGKSIPGAAATLVGTILVISLQNIFALSVDEYITLAVAVISMAGLVVLFHKCLPFNNLRAALFILMIAGLAVGILCFKPIFSLTTFNLEMTLLLVAITVITISAYFILNIITKKFIEKQEEKAKA